MNTIKRITVIFFAVIVMAANLPLCVSAVDPVSATTMANALAQAITAYGASQGVSMTFDVASTDGIGEGVHELWDQFVEDVNDPNTPTYDSLAVTIWSSLYSKIGNNLGVNISSSELPYIDSFWNWLLSGPAEMTKVDNQYYEWSLNQNNTVDPIAVYNNSYISCNGYSFYSLPYSLKYTYQNDPTDYFVQTITPVSGDVYYISNNDGVFSVSFASGAVVHNYSVFGNGNVLRDTDYTLSRKNSYLYSGLYSGATYGSYSVSISDLPNYNIAFNLNDFASSLDSDTVTETLSNDINVKPYIGDSIPQNVYIPDNTDVNYNPTDVAIPLDIPWDNTLFGDGDGVLTDAQSEAAAAAADDAITDSLEKTLTLADTENPDIPAPNEVYIPLLPVELPNFNFSLSGIWHYVVSWVQSLGAWLSLMFQTWAVLPSAITIPVYATAVIVIVLGVYKRFFM